MSKSITNEILENVSSKRLVEMPEGGDSPMGLLGQVLDTATSEGWSYDEIDFANDEGGYEFFQYSPAGEDFSFTACYGDKGLSDDEKGAKLIEDIESYADDFDEEEHAEMWIGGNGAPGLKTLVQDAEDIHDMLISLADELRKINNPMNESYVYNWKDDVEDVEATEANDDIWYAVAENMCEKEPDEYGEDPYEVMSNIINLFKVSKRSRLYKYLLKWYGSEEKLLDNVRDVYETNDAIYFVTGCGYAIFDADLLGGNADGETERKFNDFVSKEEGLNESVNEGTPFYHTATIFYDDYTDEVDCVVDNRDKFPNITDEDLHNAFENDNLDVYRNKMSDIELFDNKGWLKFKRKDKDGQFHFVITESTSLKEDFWNPGKYFKLLQDIMYKDNGMDKWNESTQEEREALVRPYLQEFWDKYKAEMSDEDIKDLFYDMEDSNYHTPANVLEDIMKVDGKDLTESAKVKLTEAPEDISEEEEEYDVELNQEEVPNEEVSTEEMSDEEYEEEAEDDAKDIVKDDVEEPWYATTPELDELREVLPELDYRLFLVDTDMACIGRLNGPDEEVLTSNREALEKDAEVSDSNDKAEEVEERAEEQEEESYEYIWIKRPSTKEEFLNQVNVLYLSPDMSEEDKEQYAGLEVNHENLLDYLKSELPEDKREEVDEKEIEEPVEEIPEECDEDVEITIEEPEEDKEEK